MIPGLKGQVGFGSAAPTSGYIGTASDTVNRTTYTFSDVPIGDAETGRMVVVGVFGDRNVGTPSTVTSVTIGGTTATSVASRTDDSLIVNLRHAQKDTGETADIVVTFGQAQSQCVIAVFALYGLASHTKEAAGFDNAAKPLTGTLVTTVGATTIAIAQCSADRTWSAAGDGQLIEVLEATMGARSGAAYLSLSAEDTSMDISITYSAGDVFECGIWVTWN